MIVKLNRCKHCGKEYKYYVSDVCSEYNNDVYCNECYKAMMDSLRKKYQENMLLDIMCY